MTAILRYDRAGTTANHQPASTPQASGSRAVFKIEKLINVNCRSEGDRAACPALPHLSRRARILREASPADLARVDLWAVVRAHARYQGERDLRTIKHWQQSVEIGDAGLEIYAIAVLAEGVVILLLIFFLIREGLRNRELRRQTTSVNPGSTSDTPG